MFLKWKNRHYVCSCYPSQGGFEALGTTWNASLWTGASGHRGASYPSTSVKKGGVSKEDGGRNAREKQYLWASQQTFGVLHQMKPLHLLYCWTCIPGDISDALRWRLLPRYFCGWPLALQHRCLALCSPGSVCLFVPWHLAEPCDTTLCNISAIEH